MTAFARPQPQRDGLTGEFYDWCARGELRFQRCSECDRWRHPPRVRCAECGSDKWTWEKSSGHGTVYTWTVVHQALHPAFAEATPYAVIVVETEEGVRIVTNLIGAQSLRLGLPVTVEFETQLVSEGEAGLVLPIFRAGV